MNTHPVDDFDVCVEIFYVFGYAFWVMWLGQGVEFPLPLLEVQTRNQKGFPLQQTHYLSVL